MIPATQLPLAISLRKEFMDQNLAARTLMDSTSSCAGRRKSSRPPPAFSDQPRARRLVSRPLETLSITTIYLHLEAQMARLSLPNRPNKLLILHWIINRYRLSRSHPQITQTQPSTIPTLVASTIFKHLTIAQLISINSERMVLDAMIIAD